MTATVHVGCSSHDSDSILTSGIYASLGATALGDGQTYVHGTLYLGDPIHLDFVDLVGDDQLVATHDGQDKVMSESQLFGTVAYRAVYDGDETDSEYQIALLRSVDDGAPSSTCTLPPPFELLTEADIEVSRAAGFTIEWDQAGSDDRMTWELHGDCIRRTSDPIVGDTGSHVVAPGLVLPAGATSDESCEVTLELRRSRDGNLDSGYGEGGSIRGNQLRTITLTSVP